MPERNHREDAPPTRRVKRHVIGKRHGFFAVVTPGFEATAARELEEIGIEGPLEPTEGGVRFTARLDGCYRANLAARTVTRILMRLTSFSAQHFGTLRERVAGFPWELHLSPGARLRFRVASSGSRLYHEGRIEEELASGIRARAGQFGLRLTFDSGDDPGVQTVFVRVRNDRVRISLDTSGGFLHKRGRRRLMADASLRETVAAAILREAGWPGPELLIDPMCGAGTFAIEAHEMAGGVLANADREFPFFGWPAFRRPAFEHLRKELVAEGRERARQRDPCRILAFDRDPRAVEAARRNLAAAGPAVTVEQGDFFIRDAPPAARPLYVLNPPYGKRSSSGNPKALYREIGRVLRDRAPAGYAVIVPGLELEKALSLGHDKKILFRNGGIPVAAVIRC